MLIWINMFFFLTLCERKDANSSVFSLEIGKFQNITVLVTKAKFEGNNSHFLYFLGIRNYETSLTTQEQKLCYIHSQLALHFYYALKCITWLFMHSVLCISLHYAYII